MCSFRHGNKSLLEFLYCRAAKERRALSWLSHNTHIRVYLLKYTQIQIHLYDRAVIFSKCSDERKFVYPCFSRTARGFEYMKFLASRRCYIQLSLDLGEIFVAKLHPYHAHIHKALVRRPIKMFSFTSYRIESKV